MLLKCSILNFCLTTVFTYGSYEISKKKSSRKHSLMKYVLSNVMSTSDPSMSTEGYHVPGALLCLSIQLFIYTVE